jgi:hypothetical protein
MINANEAILQRWIEEVWNKGNEEAIDELFDKDGVAVCLITPRHHPIRGIENLKQYFRQIREAFLDIDITVIELFSEGEKVVASCGFKANRRKVNSEGTVRIIPINVTGLCQIKVRNTKIFDAWNNFDVLSGT